MITTYLVQKYTYIGEDNAMKFSTMVFIDIANSNKKARRS